MKGNNLLIVLPLFLSLGLCGCPPEVPNGGADSISIPKKTPIEEPCDVVCSKPSKIRIFIENGPSMWGYAHMGNGFAEDVKRFVMNAQDVSDNIEVSLIGIEQKKLDCNPTSLAKKICDTGVFVDKVKSKGASTDVYELLSSVVEQTKKNEISVLISDFILSPGGQDASKYFEDNKLSICGIVKHDFPSKDLNSVAVFQMNSKFTGQYWYYNDSLKRELGINIDAVRPYYIWVIGKSELVKEFTHEKFTKSDNLFNSYFVSTPYNSFNYSFVPSGKYDPLNLKDKHSVKGAYKEKNPKGEVFDFRVNLDLSKVALDSLYICDPSNYEIEGDTNYKLLNVKPSKVKDFTHQMHIEYQSKDRIKPVTLKVKLHNKFPDWVKSADGSKAWPTEKGKTYGLKSIIEGLYDGMTANGKNYFEITLNINK